jgi:hypothetical protein
MWGIITQPGLATALVDYTHALSPLGVGLVGLIWLAVGLLAALAVYEYTSQAPAPTVEAMPTPADSWEAA